MSEDHLQRLREKQKELDNQLNEYLSKTKHSWDESLRKGQEQYRAFLTGQIEVVQNQMRSAIRSGNDMMITMYKMMLDAYFQMLGLKY
jgi:putative sterol carrier protein